MPQRSLKLVPTQRQSRSSEDLQTTTRLREKYFGCQSLGSDLTSRGRSKSKSKERSSDRISSLLCNSFSYIFLSLTRTQDVPGREPEAAKWSTFTSPDVPSSPVSPILKLQVCHADGIGISQPPSSLLKTISVLCPCDYLTLLVITTPHRAHQCVKRWGVNHITNGGSPSSHHGEFEYWNDNGFGITKNDFKELRKSQSRY